MTSLDNVLHRLGSFDRYLVGEALVLRHIPRTGSTSFDVICRQVQRDCQQIKARYPDFHFTKLVDNSPIAEVLQALYNTNLLQAFPMNDGSFDPEHLRDWRNASIEYAEGGQKYRDSLQQRVGVTLGRLGLS